MEGRFGRPQKTFIEKIVIVEDILPGKLK